MSNGPAAKVLIDSSGNPINAGNPLFTNLVDLTVYNVLYSPYGADPTGVNDSTTAINNAIQAAVTAGGGLVLLPPGTYKTSASIVVSSMVLLRGYGFSSIIKPVSGANFDVIQTPIPASSGLAGFTQNYLGIEQLAIDCSNMTGTTAGAGNAIHTYGTRYSFFRDLYIHNCPNWAILLDGDSTNFGFDNVIQRCIFDLNNGGVFINSCEANDFFDNRFKWAGSATAAAQPAFGTQTTFANHLDLNSGYCSVVANVFGKGGTYTTPAVLCSNSGPCKIAFNRFDQCRAQAVTLNAGNHEFIANAIGSACSANLGNPAIQVGSSNNRVCLNSFDTTAGAAHHTFCISEAGGPFTKNVYSDNELIAGSSGNGFFSINATSTPLIHHNAGYNPVGSVSAPGFPNTTVAVTNNTGVDVTAFVANGTGAITQIQIAGAGGSLVTTGMQIAASGWASIRLPSGGQINFTYSSGTPTWTWFGD